jgi:hypothetical protein
MTQSRTRAGNVPFMDYSNLVDTSSTSMTSSFTTRKRGSGKTWVIVREFDTGEEADSVRKSKEWAYFYGGKSIEGNYVVMRCSKSRQTISKARQDKLNERKAAKKMRMSTEVENFVDDVAEVAINRCSKCIKLLYKADSSKVLMFEDGDEHEFHDFDIVEMDKIRSVIIKLFDSGVTKPSSIHQQLRTQNPPLGKLPNKTQLYYELKKIREEKFGVAKISMKVLNEWLKEHSVIPDDEDEAFVVKFETGVNLAFSGVNVELNDDIDEGKEDENEDFGLYFRFFVSTKRLLKIAIDKKHITTDATYKLLWLGFPVIIVGTTCKNNNFHPYGIGLSSNEKTKDFKLMFESVKEGVKILGAEIKPHILQADAASAISRGFEQAFEYKDESEYTRLNCWSHVNRNCDHRLICVKDIKVKEQIKEDIKCLQMSDNENKFRKLCDLFLKKWRSVDASVNTFCDYFNDNWLLKNYKWFEGAAPGYPSTNNGLEGTNNDIKNSYTFRERLPMNEFLVLMLSIAKTWSLQRNESKDKPDKPIYKEVPLTDRRWSDAIKFAVSKTVIHQQKDSFYFNYDSTSKITKANISNYVKLVDDLKIKTFDDYSKLISIVGRVKLDQ